MSYTETKVILGDEIMPQLGVAIHVLEIPDAEAKD